MAALAGLVPWALVGIRQMLRPGLAPGLVVGADRQEPGVFALGAGVGLERDGGEAGDLGEPGLQVPE